mmetsp:Transcript_67786/g.219025  ORF Transcript_67786/g.219025 Transcript_67786/m.219025 type:complete len:505 (-) Transcript_67786:127-1641(-)
MTVDTASGRPLVSKVRPAESRPAPSMLGPFCHSRKLNMYSFSWLPSSVKETALASLAKAAIATRGPSARGAYADTSSMASCFRPSKPSSEMEPLESTSNTTSSGVPEHVMLSASVQAFTLQGRCCKRSSASLAGHCPLPTERSFTSRWRLCVPPSHARLQKDHPDQPRSTQSTVQGGPLQTRSSTRFGQPSPPFRACTRVARVRCCRPLSHWAEHLDQPLHMLTSQSVGHASSLQDRFISKGGHCTPPSPAGEMTSRVANCVPLPQVTLQAPSCQSVTSQSSGSVVRPARSQSWSRMRCRPQTWRCRMALTFLAQLAVSLWNLRSKASLSVSRCSSCWLRALVLDVASANCSERSCCMWAACRISDSSNARSSSHALRLAAATFRSCALPSASSPAISSTTSKVFSQACFSMRHCAGQRCKATARSCSSHGWSRRAKRGRSRGSLGRVRLRAERLRHGFPAASCKKLPPPHCSPIFFRSCEMVQASFFRANSWDLCACCSSKHW